MMLALLVGCTGNLPIGTGEPSPILQLQAETLRIHGLPIPDNVNGMVTANEAAGYLGITGRSFASFQELNEAVESPGLSLMFEGGTAGQDGGGGGGPGGGGPGGGGPGGGGPGGGGPGGDGPGGDGPGGGGPSGETGQG